MARVGVFICQCGKNISSVVDVDKVVEAVKGVRHVAHAATLQYSCSDLGQNTLKDAIKEYGLDSVVVAACTPRMHEGTFQKCISAAGLNPYMFEMVNIREQCSWVHPETDISTAKTIRLVKMGIAKVSQACTPRTSQVPRGKAGPYHRRRHCRYASGTRYGQCLLPCDHS